MLEFLGNPTENLRNTLRLSPTQKLPRLYKEKALGI